MKNRSRAITPFTVHHKIPGISLLACLLVLLLSWQAIAQTDPWEPVGPSGGTFIGSVSDPADAEDITAVMAYPSPSHVYRTQDGGTSWNKIGTIPYAYLYDMCAHDYSNLYVVSYYRCYYSTNGGVNWSDGSFPASSGYARCVCVDPGNANNVYAAGYKYESVGPTYSLAFFKSTNGGASWTASQHFAFAGLYIYDMAVSASNSNVLYVCGYKRVGDYYYAALLQTTDGGITWNDISSAVDTATYRYLYALAVDPTDSNKVYVGGSYFYYSTDGGGTFTRYTSYALNTRGLGIDPVNPANLYSAGSSGHVFVSKDYGVNWTPHYYAVAGSYTHVEVAPADPTRVHVATTYGGFFRSLDSGATWNPAHQGIFGQIIPTLAVAPSAPETIFADFYNTFTLTASYDCAQNWETKTYPSGCSGTMADLIVNSMDPNILLALEESG
jgi:photosystem II stability/assembly factor-like uncharacterized protein